MEVVHLARAVAVGGPQAVRTGVAAAENDHVASGGADGIRHPVPGHQPVLASQVLHGEVHALQIPPGNRKVSRRQRPDREDDRVEAPCERVEIEVLTDVDAGFKLDPFGAHLIETAVQPLLLHLEVGDAVAQQASRPVVPLEHGHRVTDPRELLGGGESGRSRSHHRHRVSGGGVAGRGRYPPFLPCVVDDLLLDLADGDRFAADVEHARFFAWRGTYAARELRKVVGGVKPLARLAPPRAGDEIVPVRNVVAQWASLVAERDAAVDAARRLLAKRPRSQVALDLPPVPDPFLRGAFRQAASRNLDECGALSHLRRMCLRVLALPVESLPSAKRPLSVPALRNAKPACLPGRAGARRPPSAAP